MPEIYAYEPEDLNRTRNCLANGFRILLVSVIFWVIMAALIWRGLTIIGGG